MTRTVAEVIAEAMQAYGVPWVAGIPGHGNWALTHALSGGADRPAFVQTMNEQSAVHMADAHFRLTGQPAAAAASIGPGATNTLTGLATAYADSSAALLVTGSAATHMRGQAVMQALERKQVPDFPRLCEPVTKAAFDLVHPDLTASFLHRAFNAMRSGRPGPVALDVPLDVQVAATEVQVQPLPGRSARPGARPHHADVVRAAALLSQAERPCLVAGGGVLTARAAPALRRLAERLQAPVVFTWNGKGAFPEDHPLCAGPIGVSGSVPGNLAAGGADVILALGCRFTDWTSSSYRRGVTYAIPPSRLIHVDIDPEVIGRAYPTEVAMAADVGAALADLLDELGQAPQPASIAKAGWLDRLARETRAWSELLARRRAARAAPFGMLAVLERLRAVLPRETIVTVGSGHCQGAVRQGFPVFEPHTHVTSGGYSTMGFAVPAAIAAALAKPGTPVVAVVGDGDMLMSSPELATAAMLGARVVFLVLNNAGFMSIRDGQDALFGRNVGAAFMRGGGGGNAGWAADFAALGRAYGLARTMRADSLDALADDVTKALQADGPTLVEVPIAQDPTVSGAEPAGWWDFPPRPDSDPAILRDWHLGRAAQQHLGCDTDRVPLEPPIGIYG